MSIPPQRVRTVAVVGHTGSGKTTLVEALLATGGVVSRMGRVEDGTTVSDHEPEEKERGGSLFTAAATMAWTPHVEPGGPEEQPHLVQLLDCPGDPDLLGQVGAALHVADLVLVVVGPLTECRSGPSWPGASATS